MKKIVLVAIVATAAAGCGAEAAPKTDSAKPAAAKGVVNIELSTAGCKVSPNKVAAGPLTFKVTNTDAAGATEVELVEDERILGEKENLAPGFSGTFSLRVDGGDYRIYCPGTEDEYTDLTVTGKAATSTGDVAKLLEQGAGTYATYVNGQTKLLVQNVRPLVAAIKAKDLARAQQAYADARIYYERIEPVAESFQDLDPAIDARAGDVPASEWTGFHPIEKGLFAKKSVAGLAPLADKLLEDCQTLAAKTKNLTYQPAELLNGAGGLLDEISASKITGEEERYSHIDMLDFWANVEGAEQAYANVKPALKIIDPALTATITERFAAVDALLNKYRDPNELGGFVRYGKLTAADKRSLSHAIDALKQPVSEAGSKVASA